MPAADWLWHGCHDCMDIWCIRKLFGHWAHLCLHWFGTVGWIIGLGRLRLPVRLSSRVQMVLSQHTPVILERYCQRISLYVNDPVLELGKESPLKWFGEIVTKHFCRRAVFPPQLARSVTK